MKTLILANGVIRDYEITRKKQTGYDYIIACDGGIRHAQALGITPDCLLGDMDSVPDGIVETYAGRALRFPPEKDSTDLALAMEHALREQASDITILGALGGRFDHELANIHVLAMALAAGTPAEIKDERTGIRIIDREIVLEREDYEFITLIPLTTSVSGITTQGLYYPLCGEELRTGATRGVSNRFNGEKASVSIKSGLLIVIRIKE
jgi:thiamine pyrophosphokinase